MTSVWRPKKELEALMASEAAAIRAQEIVVLYIDQCHLIWSEARGDVWGPSSQRVRIPVLNERERQTYYGAINPVTGDVTVILADAGNGYWTAIFVEYVRKHYNEKRLLICWDGASYHRGQEMRAYLEAVNAGRARETGR